MAYYSLASGKNASLLVIGYFDFFPSVTASVFYSGILTFGDVYFSLLFLFPDGDLAGHLKVLMITHKRAEYLKRSLASLLRHRTKSELYPIIASQDFDG